MFESIEERNYSSDSLDSILSQKCFNQIFATTVTWIVGLIQSFVGLEYRHNCETNFLILRTDLTSNWSSNSVTQKKISQTLFEIKERDFKIDSLLWSALLSKYFCYYWHKWLLFLLFLYPAKEKYQQIGPYFSEKERK